MSDDNLAPASSTCCCSCCNVLASKHPGAKLSCCNACKGQLKRQNYGWNWIHGLAALAASITEICVLVLFQYIFQCPLKSLDFRNKNGPNSQRLGVGSRHPPSKGSRCRFASSTRRRSEDAKQLTPWWSLGRVDSVFRLSDWSAVGNDLHAFNDFTWPLEIGDWELKRGEMSRFLHGKGM